MLIRVLLLLALATPAAAQQGPCGPTPIFIMTLMSNYGERVVDEERLPSSLDPSVMITWQVWTNPETRSWTFTGATFQVMCLRASGQNYSGQNVRDLLKIDQPT